MPISSKFGKRLGLGLAATVLVGLAAFFILRAFVVPALIVRTLEARTGSRVTIRDYWLDGKSAGVTGLEIHDGIDAASPVWASAEKVRTDLSLGGLVRGRFAPGKVEMDGMEIKLAFAADGNLLTKVQFKSDGPSGPAPIVVTKGATVRLRQAGRPEMVVKGVTARLGPDGTEVNLAVRSNDPEWGPVQAMGQFDPTFKTGRIEMKSVAPIAVNAGKVKAIPFVPAEVWQNFTPKGEVDIRLTVDIGKAGLPPIFVKTEIGLRGTSARSETLDLNAAKTTGRVIVDGAVVTIDGVSGEAIGGQVKSNGTLDFTKSPPRCDVKLDLNRVNVADAPKSWQLGDAGLTGRLTGKVRLLAFLRVDGVDLSGSSGDAVVENGTVNGIPFTKLRLQMHASGGDLQYESPPGKTSSQDGRPTGGGDELSALALSELIALQVIDDPKPTIDPAPPSKPAFQLPKSLSTYLELEDVDISHLVTRAQMLLGYPFPLPITGRLALKANATVPLGKLQNIRGYVFHGDLTLTKASVFRVDIGRASARVDLADGFLELKDLRGRLVDRPNGGPDNPPGRADEVPETGPLPRGGFRGKLQAALSPPGKLTASFEGHELPLGELAAPVFPRPTPLSGDATLTVDTSVDLSNASDPLAWSATGSVNSQQVKYGVATLDAFSAKAALKGGRLDFTELDALMNSRPLKAKFGVDLRAPQAFRGSLDVAGWPLSQVLAWVPSAPKPSPIAGAFSAKAEASGTLGPFMLQTDGQGRLDTFQAGPIALGDLPFGWTTRGDSVLISLHDAHPFGGKVTAEASVPLSSDRPIEGKAELTAVDTAALSGSIPDDRLKLTGKASGLVTFTVPSDVSSLDAVVRLSAPDLTVQGLPVEQVQASVRAHKGSVGYELTADSLGGKVKLTGSVPLKGVSIHESDGQFRAAGFTLDRLWKAYGLTGTLARVTGEGAVDANIRALLEGENAGLYAHGVTEFRDLRWGDSVSLGRMRGIVALSPTSWRIEPLSGDLLGGTLGGNLWGASPGSKPALDQPFEAEKPRLGFDVRLDRLSLQNVLAPLPIQGFGVEGTGNLRLTGTMGETLRASAELDVARARVAGLPLSELRLPAEVVTADGHASGTVTVRRWSARLAGGRVQGEASFRLGLDRAFQSDVSLTGVDLESIARIASDARRPASGKVSGKVSIHGPDPYRPNHYRGRVVLDLDDASLVALPLFREIDRFLGAARGGLFEDGDLIGTIANRQLFVETMTLEGRVVQLHATGTVGFEGQLNLEVLVNTNQIIPQTGQALVSAIPGLSNLVGRNREAKLQVANYLSNKLLKLRVIGTLRNPSVSLDAGVAVADSALGFFSGVLKLPFGFVK